MQFPPCFHFSSHSYTKPPSTHDTVSTIPTSTFKYLDGPFVKYLALPSAKAHHQDNCNAKRMAPPDHSITLAGGVDAKEVHTLQGALSKIVDAEIMARLSSRYEN